MIDDRDAPDEQPVGSWGIQDGRFTGSVPAPADDADDAEIVSEGNEPDEHGSHLEADAEADGERQEPAEPDEADEADASDIDPSEIELVNRETGEPIDPVAHAEANADLARNGLDYDIAEYVGALSALEHLPEDGEASQSFLLAALNAGMSPDQVKAAYAFVQQGREAQAEADLSTKDQRLGELRDLWGRDFDQNLGTLRNWVDSLPEGLGQAIAEARLPDGQRLLNHPAFPDYFVKLAARAGTASQAEGPMSYDTPSSELDAINKVLATDPQRYWREKLDQRAVELRRESQQRGPAANSYAAQRIQTELGQISKTLRTNPDLYWKRDMGKRATELRRQLEGIQASNAARGR